MARAEFPLLHPDISVFGACSPFDPRLSLIAKKPGYNNSSSNEVSTSVFSWCPVAIGLTSNRWCGLPCVSVVVTLKLILIMCLLFLVTTVILFFFFFFHCKLNTRRCGGLQSQGINSAISSLMFFCPGMKMVVLGNGYFYTTICSLRTGLRPPVAYHWRLSSHHAIQITSGLCYAVVRDGKAG